MKRVLAGIGILALASVAANAAQVTMDLTTTSNTIDAPLNSNPAYTSSSYYNYLGEVDGGTLATNVLIRFDLPTLPGGSSVTGATLRIVQYGSNTSQTASVHAILKNWTNGLTYSTYDGTNAWSSPGMGAGTDYEAASSASVAFDATGWHDIDITGQYQQWFSAAEANYGLVLVPTNLDNTYVELAATEPVNGSNPPYGLELVVDYVPEPAGLSTIVVAGLALARRRAVR